MKKIILLFSVIIYCLSAKSQNFNVSPTIQTSGNDITLTATGESNLDHYTSISSVGIQQFSSNVTLTIKSTSYFTSQSNPTKVVVTVKNTGTQSATVNLLITGYVQNDGNQTSMQITANGNQQLQINPASTVFYNTAVSGSFTKQGCGGGSMGSTVTYSVPANKYSASTQTGAQQLATTDLSTNGPTYANANGQCIPVYTRLVGTVNSGEGSNVIAHFYSDAACTMPLALPGSITLTVTWTKYYYSGASYTVNSVNTVAQGATYFSIGHRQFYSTIPPSTIYVDWVASVVLDNTNPNYTAEPNYGIFTNN